jgi:hypothetical protein
VNERETDTAERKRNKLGDRGWWLREGRVDGVDN